MEYIVFSIDNNVQEFLFIIEYTKAENNNILGELVKLSNLCYIKDFDFDFFDVPANPSIEFSKEGIYIYKYEGFTDVLNRLNIKLNADDIAFFKKASKEMYHIMVNNSKPEIMSIINNKEGEYHELLKKFFESKS